MATTPLIPFAKPALSYADQVALLKQRGIVIADDAAAERLLAGISYYRLSAYWYPFRQRDATGQLLSTVQPGTPFESVIDLYEFDRQLRILVLDALERVEVAIRTAVTLRIGVVYGAFGHENPASFHPQFDHAGWVANLRTETQRSSDAFVGHYRARYQGFPALPIWMTTELISLGGLSKLYKGMKPDDRRAVANPLALHHRRLQDWLHVLTYVRNVCAHHSRLWNRELAIRPHAMPEPQWNAPLLPRQDRLFCVLLILRYLLQQTGNGVAWRDQCTVLLTPIAADPRWRAAMGMGPNWVTHPYWV
jgi:abortive infection bacteriophage resistance protein